MLIQPILGPASGYALDPSVQAPPGPALDSQLDDAKLSKEQDKD
jgi:hypothetical protein